MEWGCDGYLGVPEVGAEIVALLPQLEGDDLVHPGRGGGMEVSARKPLQHLLFLTIPGGLIGKRDVFLRQVAVADGVADQDAPPLSVSIPPVRHPQFSPTSKMTAVQKHGTSALQRAKRKHAKIGSSMVRLGLEPRTLAYEEHEDSSIRTM